MSNSGVFQSPYGQASRGLSGDGLVDRVVGDAYPTVKYVADNLPATLAAVGSTADNLEASNIARAGAEAAESAAATSAANALESEGATAEDRTQTGIDRTVSTENKNQTILDRTQTGLDRTQTGLDRVQVAADKAQTAVYVAEALVSKNSAYTNSVIAANAASAAITLAFRYTTLSAANADIATFAENQSVEITADGVNNGIWYKNGSSATTLTYAGPSTTTVAAAATIATFGNSISVTGTESGYYSRTTGEKITDSDFKRTLLIEVGPDTEVFRSGSNISGTSGVGTITFYGAGGVLDWIGSYGNATGTNSFKIKDVSPNAKFMAVSNTVAGELTLTIKHNIAANRIVGQEDMTARSDGFLTNKAFTISNDDCTVGYISNSVGPGSLVEDVGFIVTNPFPVGPKTKIQRTGSSLSSGSTVAVISFFDETGAYLGRAGNGGITTSVIVGDVFPTARTARVSNTVETPLSVSVTYLLDVNQIAGGSLATLEAALIKDLYAAETVTGFIGITGNFSGPPSGAAWTTTKHIPASVGSKFILTATASSSAALISYFDKDLNWLGYLPGTSANKLEITISQPNTAYIRATAQTAQPKSLIGVSIPATSTASEIEVVAHIPSAVYGIANEPLYIYMDGIVNDSSVELTTNLFESNQKFARVNANAGTITATLRARRGEKSRDIGSFPIHLMDASLLVNPPEPRLIFSLGDSTTHTLQKAGYQGAVANEVSRRLTGIGRAASLPGVALPTPKNFTNIKFLGTQGTEIIKHNGHPGWSANTFLTRTNLDASPSIYWDPALLRFSWKYFIEGNGFDSGLTPVSADGSNMTIIINLDWNNLGDSPATTQQKLGEMIDIIRTEYPQCDIILEGANPSPKFNFKDSSRFWTGQELFNTYVQPMGEAKRILAATKNCDFLQISHLIDADSAYSTKTYLTGARTTQTMTASEDAVHSGLAGYAMRADAEYYYILQKYCRV